MLRITNCLLVVLLCVLVMAGPGCAQNTESGVGVATQTQQKSQTPQSIKIEFTLNNGPDAKKNADDTADPDGDAELTTPDDSPMPVTAKAKAGRFTQINNIWIDTSGTASTAGEARGSGAGTATVSPTQDVKADVGISFIMELAWQAALWGQQHLQGNGTAAGAGDPGSATGGAQTSDQTTPITANLGVPAKKKTVNAVSTTQPTTKPAQ